jgi:acetyl/propionyl-CoA carboxylase alpha subunit
MNTRLQVEHPVTEAVLGVDLVREQLRIAAGCGLSFSQSELRPTGHAIECRICAEQPEREFRPATGRIGVLRLPESENVRFDGGIRAGQPVTAAFDSLLGKLIAWGPTRAEAAATLEHALRETVILGVPTNVDYLARIMQHPEFLAGRLHTGFLSAYASELVSPPPSAGEEAAVAIAAAFTDVDFRRVVFEVPEPHASIGYWRN